MTLTRHIWLQGWSPQSAVHREFQTAEGHARYRLPVGLFYLLRLGWPDALFPPIVGLSVAGAWVLIQHRRTLEAELLLGWPIVTWAFISGIPFENPRFIWPALPAIAALAGFGYQALRDRFGVRQRAALAAGLVASLAAGLMWATREHMRVVAGKDAERAVVAWVDANVPRAATVWESGGTLLAELYGASKVLDVYRYSPTDIPMLLGRGCPCFYLHREDDSAKLAGLPTQVFFDHLRHSPGLTAVASRPPFILYRIGR